METRKERRSFLAQAAAAAATMGIPAKASPENPFAAMTWLNPAASCERTGDVWRITSKPQTDFWRHTAIDYVADSGHFLHRTVRGMFTFELCVNAQYPEEFQQAGIMVRLDGENWIKCGTEFFGGRRHASTVFTRGFSDWATAPDLSQSGPVWWRVERSPNAFVVHASADGKAFDLIRAAQFVSTDTLEVGMMCCAPKERGFEAIFDRLQLSQA